MLTTTTPWERYGKALVRFGLSPEDAAVLLEQAREARAMFSIGGSDPPLLFPLVQARLDEASWAALVDAVAETQARGPFAAPARAVWRVLYVEGCPIDHLWQVFYHCFNDPDSDPQDWVTVEPERALAEAKRYAALQFPRAAGPWPGLGCNNTIDSVGNRLASGAARRVLGSMFAVNELIKARTVASAILSETLDHEAHLPDPFRRTLVKSSPFETDPGLVEWVEGRSTDEIFDLASRWVQALVELLGAHRAVHDVGGDRFVLHGETIDETRHALRSEPAPPADQRAALRAIIAPWDDAFRPPWGKEEESLDALLDQRDHDDPLHWLTSVAERTLVVWDEGATGIPRLRNPP